MLNSCNMYDESFLNKISSFGVLGYSVEKIIFLVDPENPEALKRDIETPGTDVYKAYWKGKRTKDRDTDANERMRNRMQLDKINDKINESFGL